MAKLIDITGRVLSGEWGTYDELGNGIPVIRTTNFTNEGVINYNNVVTRRITKKNIDEKYLCNGDIIIEKSGGSDKFPVGRVVYFDGNENTYLFNNFTGVLRVKNQNIWYPKYVFYSLFANYKRGGTRTFENKTTGLHNLKTDYYVSQYEIAEKDKKEQILICEKLDRLYGVIELREREVKLLDDLIKARFVELFGDPVINPYGYDKVALSDLADIKIGPFGSLLHKHDYIENGHPLINPSHIIDGNILPDDKLSISDEKYNELSSYQLKIDDVVMGRRGEMGRCAIVKKEGFLCGTGSLLIRTKGEVKSDYIQKIISFPSFKKTIEDIAVGQTMPNLNVPIVSSFQIIKPPMEVQDSYYNFVKQVDKSKVVYMYILKIRKYLMYNSKYREKVNCI